MNFSTIPDLKFVNLIAYRTVLRFRDGSVLPLLPATSDTLPKRTRIDEESIQCRAPYRDNPEHYDTIHFCQDRLAGVDKYPPRQENTFYIALLETAEAAWKERRYDFVYIVRRNEKGEVTSLGYSPDVADIETALRNRCSICGTHISHGTKTCETCLNNLAAASYL